MKHYILSILALLLLCPWIASCSDDEGPNLVAYTNIVTFQQNQGPYSVFSYQKLNDSPEIQLTARVNIDNRVLNDGGRVRITYEYLDKGQTEGSGMIALMSVNRIYTDTVSAVAYVPATFSQPYKTVALQRSGTWLNLYCDAGEVSKFTDRKFTIVVDQNTLADEYPQLYISTDVEQGVRPGLDAHTWVSVSIKDVWELPTCKGVDVHVYTDGDTPAVYNFPKSSLL